MKNTEDSLKVMIVDDHPIVREGLSELVQQEEGFSVCFEAESAEQALDNFEKNLPDIMIIDISLQGTDGIELSKIILNIYPKILILIMSMHDEKIFAERALRAGAKGYVMKHEGTDNVVEAINKIIQGEIYLSPAMNSVIIQNYFKGNEKKSSSPIQKLSDREFGVFELIGQGNGTKKIAEILHLSVKTIESHRENIKKKLILKNSIELLQRATLWIEEKK